MSMLESASDTRQFRQDFVNSEHPSQPRERDLGRMQMQGFAAPDAFRPLERRQSLATFEYEEGESI